MLVPILIIAASVAMVAAVAMAGAVKPYRPALTIPVAAILSFIVAAGFSLISMAGGGG